MAQTTPKPESILANVATELSEITTVGSAFRTTVATVNRQFINPDKLAGTLLPALAVYGEDLEYEVGRVGATPRQEGTLRFKIQGILRATTTPATDLLSLVQDVREKLFEDRSRGGYANNTAIGRIEFGGGADFGNPPFVAHPFHGFLMEVECHFTENL